MVNFIRFCWLLICVMLSISSLSHAEETKKGTVTAKSFLFSVSYAIVSHTLKHDQGCFDKLNSDDPKMINISEYWYDYGQRSCEDYFYNAKETARARNLEGEELIEFIRETHRTCLNMFIFDNWDRINQTISDNPSKECLPNK